MKAIIFILGFLFVTNSNAQKFDCSSKIKTYTDFLKEQKISESYDSWSEVRKNCPKESEATYTDGIQILQYRIENATETDKEKAVRDLMKLYDQYYKNFPASIPHYEVQKAMLLVDNKIEAKDETYALLDSGFAKAGQSVTSANAFYTYFRLLTERFNAGDKKITANQVLEKYTMVNSLLNQLKVSQKEVTEYKTAQHAIDNLIKDIATCDNLAEYYTKNFENNKENADWITSALISLSGKCSSKPIFLTLAEKLYAIQKNSQSANFVAIGYVKQRKFPEAIQFYNEAADLQTNPLEKAQIYYTLATGLLATDLPKSKDYLNKALVADPKLGKAYIYLAQMYVNGSKDCGQTDFEKKAVYYLAIETVKKAGLFDERLKATAEKMASDFTPKSLTATEISKSKMNGKSLTIGCWINETITFPGK